MKKKGFTLTEILLTLGIIGLIGMLVAPTLSRTYSEAERKAKVQKVYEILQSAALKSTSNDSDMVVFAGTTAINTYRGIELWFDTYLNPYIVTQRVCRIVSGSRKSGCWSDTEQTKNYSGAGFGTLYRAGQGLASYEYISAVLNDGIFISISSWDSVQFPRLTGHPATGKNDIVAHFDINGNKGPNKVGEDVFVIYWDDDKKAFFPAYEGASEEEINKFCDSKESDVFSGSSCIQKYL